MKILLTLIFAASCFAQGPVVRGGGPTVVGSLPTAATNRNRVYNISDGASASDCTVGAGSTKVNCVSNGVIWQAVGGSGTLTGCGANMTLNGTVCDVNTATIGTKAADQTGAALLVTETSASSTVYTGTMSPTLGAYTAKQSLTLAFVTACSAAGFTMNVDTLGAKSVKLYDGTTNPTLADCAAGTIRTAKYDGTVFRLDGGPVGATVATMTGPYNLTGGFTLNNGPTSTATNRVTYSVFYVDSPRSFSFYKFWCQTGPCGDQGFAIYNSSYNLVANSSASLATVGTGTTYRLAIGATITLQPGKYYLAWTTNVTTAVLYGTPNAYFGNLNTSEATPDFAYFYGNTNVSTGASAPFTFPATIGAQTAISTAAASPWIGVQ